MGARGGRGNELALALAGDERALEHAWGSSRGDV
jgi:hypothetical protein